MRIVLIGSGNVATLLGKKMIIADHEIIQVYSRSRAAAALLAGNLQAGYTDLLSEIDQSADLYVLAISDRGIMELAENLSLGKKMVAHTAGSVSKNVLAKMSDRYGVLYPVQSLRKEMNELPEIPLLVDGNTPETVQLLYDFSFTISGDVQIASDEKRRTLHVAAVVVSNFTNHLYTLAAAYCKNENADFRMLTPLIKEVAGRTEFHLPGSVQTGPAIRKDMDTIKTHLELLQRYPDLSELYKVFTKQLMDYYQ
jgi:predicted short-subunit dehydrogenase-like oxidoreductase (DUF2520 family)